MDSSLRLTSDEEAGLEITRRKWLSDLVSTKPANRKRTEEGVRRTYQAAGLPEPELFLWFDGLLEAALAAEQLGNWGKWNWMLPPNALDHRKLMQQPLRRSLSVRTWPQVLKFVGVEYSSHRIEEREVPNPSPFGRKTLRLAIAVRREDTLQSGVRSFDPFDAERDDEPPMIRKLRVELDQAGISLFEQQRQLFSSLMGPGPPGHSSLDTLKPVFARDYPFGFLAVHEFLWRCCQEKTSLPYEGLWRSAHNCAAWWPFTRAAVLADRPLVVHFNSEGKLHNPEGPAIIYRSGLELYAEHGNATKRR